MKALHVALALVLVLVGGLVTVWANPGDAVAVRGTLAWPAILANEPFVVVRSDDGRFFYVDVTAARGGNAALRTGDRITVAGVEGPRPYELAATALGPGDTAVSAAQPPGSPAPPVAGDAAASPRTDSVAPPAPQPTTERQWERVHGTVQSVSGHTLVVRRDDGQEVNIDVSRLDGTVAREVRRREVVTVFGTAEQGKPFTAVGFVRTAPANSLPGTR